MLGPMGGDRRHVIRIAAQMHFLHHPFKLDFIKLPGLEMVGKSHVRNFDVEDYVTQPLVY